ncbi:uncharacterized protein LOC144648962 [Oculina patagonica]
MTKGSQFWRTNRKIIVAQKRQAGNLKQPNSKRNKGKAGDILDELRKMIAEPIAEAESSGSIPQIPEAPSAKETLEGIFRCSICFSTAHLPAAACSKCLACIGCIPCIEQWIAITPTLAKCPLCRTSRQYSIIPMVRDLACILGQEVPIDDEGSDDRDTIPYGAGDQDEDDDSQLPRML